MREPDRVDVDESVEVAVLEAVGDGVPETLPDGVSDGVTEALVACEIDPVTLGVGEPLGLGSWLGERLGVAELDAEDDPLEA